MFDFLWKVNGDRLVLFLFIRWWKRFFDSEESRCRLILEFLVFFLKSVILEGLLLKFLMCFLIYFKVFIWFNIL